MKTWSKIFVLALVVMICAAIVILPASAEGSISGAFTDTWAEAKEEIRGIVDGVVFPVLDTILVVVLFVNIAMQYFKYQQTGHIDFLTPGLILICLIFTLSAPSFIWNIIG